MAHSLLTEAVLLFFQGPIKKSLYSPKANTFQHLQKEFQNITKIIDTVLAYPKSHKTQFGILALWG
jgi:hypothetical protein